MGAQVGIHCDVKSASLIAASLLLMPCLASGQDLAEADVVAEEVPAKAIASAVQAVGELGKSVVQGRYAMALERMNPKEKDRLAKQLGGLEEVEKQLEGVAAEMVKQGVRIISCKPVGMPKAYGVEPVLVKELPAGGAGAADLDDKKGRWFFSQWLVLVPTVTRFEVMHRPQGQPAQWIKIESLSYQVAVSDRHKEDWTFIDGAGLTAARLCGLYKTLPANIELPEVKKRQVK